MNLASCRSLYKQRTQKKKERKHKKALKQKEQKQKKANAENVAEEEVDVVGGKKKRANVESDEKSKISRIRRMFRN